MNREIKFRAKGIDSNRWYYGGYAEDRSHNHVILPQDNWSKGGVVDKETICQYTGLKDKNGVEIYEGDIIKSPLGNIVVVEFGYHEELVKRKELNLIDSFASYGWIAKNIKNGLVGFLDNTFIAGEVVGNIYDNKDLLED